MNGMVPKPEMNTFLLTIWPSLINHWLQWLRLQCISQDLVINMHEKLHWLFWAYSTQGPSWPNYKFEWSKQMFWPYLKVTNFTVELHTHTRRFLLATACLSWPRGKHQNNIRFWFKLSTNTEIESTNTISPSFVQISKVVKQ